MKQLTIIIALTIMTINSFAQDAADKKFKKGNYKGAISIYKKFLADEENMYNVHAIRGLAMSYKAIKKYPESEAMFRKLIVLDTSFTDLVNYSEVLIENKKYDEANKLIAKNNLSVRKDQSVSSIQSVKNIESTIKNLNQIVNLDTGNVKITPLALNTKQPDFSAFYFQNGIVFSSARKYSLLGRSFVNKPFYASNLFFSSSKENFTKVEKFAKRLRIKGNAGPASFCSKNRTMYYTINAFPNLPIDNAKNIGIHSAYLNIDNSKWVSTINFPYNSKDYSCMHPAISTDGNTLYFVSNMPGGYGGMDIYVTTFTDKRWTKPVNLGPNVNTKEDELFPFIDNNSQLYFATKGRGGLGGLDIYVFDTNVPNAAAENIGAPFNSSSDDFGFFKSNIADKGFFSSSRGKEYSDFDIYSYTRTKPIIKNIAALAIDQSNKKVLPNAILNLDLIRNNEHKTFSSIEGKIENVEVMLGDVMNLTASAKNYLSSNTQVAVNRVDTAYFVELTKQKTGCKLVGDVKSVTTNTTVPNANIVLRNLKNLSDKMETNTDSFGRFSIVGLTKNANYEVKVTKDGYFSKTTTIETGGDCDNTVDLSSTYNVNFTLISGNVSTLENIYFDVNKYTIREDAKSELDKLVNLMKDNPEIIIEISSHTDARGSDVLNYKLSLNRSQAAINYIVSKGIRSTRLLAKGYGETKLVNSCGNNVTCDDAEHQKNRRTEFQVVGIL